ncbi:unnamed protein product [Urochloa humidicola]
MARAPPWIFARSGSCPLLLHQRGLHNFGSTPPPSKTALPKIRAGVPYVVLSGTLVYLYGWLVPRLDRMEAKVEALQKLNDDEAAVEPLQATNVSRRPQAATQNSRMCMQGLMQSSTTWKLKSPNFVPKQSHSSIALEGAIVSPI